MTHNNMKIKIEHKTFAFNPIPAGVLENQDTLGGGVNLTHVRCPNMTNDTSLESSCALNPVKK